MPKDSRYCVFCKNKSGQAELKNFNENSLQTCKTILVCRKKYNIQFSDVILPENLNNVQKYHLKCYKNFTAVGKKYRDVEVTADLDTSEPQQ